MKIFGPLLELVKIAFRKDSKEVLVEPASQTGSGPITFTLPDAVTNSATIAIRSDKLSAFASTSSSELAGVISDEVGSGKLVFNNNPTLSGNVLLQNAAGQPTLRISEDASNGTNYVEFKTPDLGASYSLTLPNTLPSANSTLTVSNTGVMGSVRYESGNTTPLSIVQRDTLGNFSAGTITATLSGNATNVTGIVASANGGTGVNNGGTLTYGANNITVTTAGVTSVTLPTSGTLATLAGSEALSNKTITASSISSDPATTVGTGAFKLPTGNSTTNRPTGTASQLKGMIRYNDTDDVFEGYNELSGWSSIGGSGTSDRITQASHGFVVGDTLYLNGSTYTKAIATSSAAAEVVGVVSRVIDSSTFELTLSGEISGLSGLTTGEVYFLSETTAGTLTTTEPSVIGQVSVPVGVASSTTTLYVAPKRGVVVGGTNARTELSLANNASTNIYTAPSGLEAAELKGWVYIDATTDYRFHLSAQFAKNGANSDWNISYQTTGDTPPSGFSVSISSGGIISITLPSVAGFVSAKVNYSINGPAVGATFPLAVDAATITTGTVAAARLPVADGSNAGIVSLSNQSLGAGDKYFAGNVGVGTTSPSSRFHVVQSADTNLAGLRVQRSSTTTEYGILSNYGGATWLSAVDTSNTGNNIIVFNNSSNGTTFTERGRIAADGAWTLGPTATKASNTINGDVTFQSPGGAASIKMLSTSISSAVGTHFIKWSNATGALSYDTSSRLVKTDITDSPYGLDAVMQLSPKKYKRTDSGNIDEIGFIADEVVSVLPELVPMMEKSILTKDENDKEIIPGGVNYDKLTAVLVKAIQELKQELDDTKAELADLKSKLW